jgi:hypothetical protein
MPVVSIRIASSRVYIWWRIWRHERKRTLADKSHGNARLGRVRSRIRLPESPRDPAGRASLLPLSAVAPTLGPTVGGGGHLALEDLVEDPDQIPAHRAADAPCRAPAPRAARSGPAPHARALRFVARVRACVHANRAVAREGWGRAIVHFENLLLRVKALRGPRESERGGGRGEREAQRSRVAEALVLQATCLTSVSSTPTSPNSFSMTATWRGRQGSERGSSLSNALAVECSCQHGEGGAGGMRTARLGP